MRERKRKKSYFSHTNTVFDNKIYLNGDVGDRITQESIIFLFIEIPFIMEKRIILFFFLR